MTVGALLLLMAKFSGLHPSNLVQQMIGGVEQTVLVAVPMFILAADIMIKGNTANRLLDVVSKFVGHIRGGLPVTTAISCTMFGAVSGSTQATVVAMGRPLRPRLIEAGYTDRFSIALIINASDIALLIPPSIGMIIYGVVSGTSVGALFIAGIGPGLMILALFPSTVTAFPSGRAYRFCPRRAGPSGSWRSSVPFWPADFRLSSLAVFIPVPSAPRRQPRCPWLMRCCWKWSSTGR